MKKNLAIGTSDFKTLREKGFYFIDKSMIIKELIDDSSLITLIPRPRRFGKTLNMSMLYYFFDRNNADENRKLFEGLQIENEAFFDREQGKYPVIGLPMRDSTLGLSRYITCKIGASKPVSSLLVTMTSFRGLFDSRK